jgi:hypothetical protein
VLTAAHCVSDLKREQIAVSFALQAGRVLQPKRVALHPTADIALLELDDYRFKPPMVPLECVRQFQRPGTDYVAYGFPEHSTIDGTRPTARLFKGHVQRILFHESTVLPYRYGALELSVGCPSGLSGGPILDAKAHHVIGIAAENLESSTVRHDIMEHNEDGRETREYHESILTYSIAVSIGSIFEWLDQEVPPTVRDAAAATD